MSKETIRGRAWRFGTDIDTDVIIPGQYTELDPAEYSKHVMEPVDPDFYNKVNQGDTIVAEVNFGIGSSREHAAVALKYAGIEAVVAESFGRIFRRNAVNQGIAPLECSLKDIKRIDTGDELEVKVFEGTVHNVTKDETYTSEKLEEPIKSILEAGGIVEYTKNNRGNA